MTSGATNANDVWIQRSYSMLRQDDEQLYGPSRRGAGKCVCKFETCKGGIECKAGVPDDNLVGKTAEVFVDDTVVKSLEMEDHVNDLATILIRLIANGITLKMEKGIWDIDELGHVVHMGEGVACDPDKVKELAAMEPM